MFPRADGTTYVCASPARAAAGRPGGRHAGSGCDRAPAGDDPRLRPRSPSADIGPQACYRPVTQDGLPLLGPVPGVAGALVATGHSVWGILNAPASGEAMAELILEGTTRHVDLRRFDPARLPTG